ncbi:MAG: fibronectin type III domain-containing protein [Cytophagales bacterium]|nr:fibronectin type III domain-containing protein [Cytophagales bacterium]
MDLTFEWTESPDADLYNFQLSTQIDFSSIEANKADLSTKSTDVENLKPLTTYFWRVNAENGGGVSPWSTTNKFTTKSLIAPTLLSPSDNSSQPINDLQFSWNAISDVSGYNLQVSTTNDFSGLIINKTNLTSTSSMISGFMYSTSYYWRVSSIKITQTRIGQPLGNSLQYRWVFPTYFLQLMNYR